MSWAELIGVRDEAVKFAAEDRARPIVECPRCGQVLDKRGDLVNCPMGHFTQRGTKRGPESV